MEHRSFLNLDQFFLRLWLICSRYYKTRFVPVASKNKLELFTDKHFQPNLNISI